MQWTASSFVLNNLIFNLIPITIVIALMNYIIIDNRIGKAKGRWSLEYFAQFCQFT